MRNKKYDVPEIHKLARIIDVLARKCWRGLPALMGDAPEPTREQIKDALFFRPSLDADLETKVSGGGSLEGREIAQEDTMIDEIDAVLSCIPWAEIVRTTKRYAKEYPEEWAIYKRYIINQEQTRSGWGTEGALMRTAEVFNTSDYIIRQRARSVPYAIARAVSMGYGREDFLKGE